MEWDEEDQQLLLTETRRQEILENLRKERELRREMIAKGDELRLSKSDLSGTPRSSLEADDQLKQIKATLKAQMQQERLLTSPKPDPKKVTRPPLSKRPPSELLQKNSPVSQANRPTQSNPGTPRQSQRSRDSDVQTWKQEIERKWTFRPAITPVPDTEALNERLDRLSRPKSEILRERELEKERLEREQVAKCTFQPKITPFFGNRGEEMMDISERLHAEASHRTHSREILAARHEETELANYTFHPRTHSQGNSSAPLHKRLEEVSKKRQEQLQKLKIAIEEAETELTFKPKVNENSQKLYSERVKIKSLAGAKIEEKLKKESEESEQKRLRLIVESEARERDKCTFAPQIREWDVRSRFEDRQAVLLEKKRQEKVAAEPECTFHPQILPVPKPRTMSPYQRIQQLSTPDAKKHALAAERAAQDFREKHPFEPEIDPLSRKLGRSSTLSELAYNEERRKELKLQAAATEEMFSFQPSLCSTTGKYTKAVSEYGQMQNISVNISARSSEKELKLGEYRRKREVEEMKECTFTPKTTRTRKETSPIVVRGLDQFFQHRDRARRLSAEQQSREAKVFNTDVYLHPPSQLITTPQPFHLHPSTKSARVEKLQADLVAKEQEECRFKPDTKASKLRGQIQSLLALLGD